MKEKQRKLTIGQLNKMLDRGQLECLNYEYVDGYVTGEYRITELGYKTLSKKIKQYFEQLSNESKNQSA